MKLRLGTVAALPAVVALAILIAPSTAAAGNRFVGAYTAHIDYHDTLADSVESFQRVDFPNPGPAATAVSGSNWNSFTSASFGEFHNYASGSLNTGGDGTHSIHNGSVSSFEDELLINTGTPGQAGVATFLIHLDGTLSAAGAGSAYYDFVSNGTVRLYVTTEDDNRGYPHRSPVNIVVDRWLTFTQSFTSGTAVAINGTFFVGADMFFNGSGSGSAVADFSHTARWGGLQSVVTTGGEDVTQLATITSGSGFDYVTAPAIAGVPEPATWALMIGGFGMAGSVLRRRRAVVAA